MQDTVKIGAAAAGGYLLGRTKKAKAAIGLALWLSGRRHVGELVRTEAQRWMQSDQAQDLVESGRRAAVSVYEAQAGRLGDALQRRAVSDEPARGRRAAARAGSGKAGRTGRSGGGYEDEHADDDDAYEDAYEDANEDANEDAYEDANEDDYADEDDDESDADVDYSQDDEFADEDADEDADDCEDDYADEDDADDAEAAPSRSRRTPARAGGRRR